MVSRPLYRSLKNHNCCLNEQFWWHVSGYQGHRSGVQQELLQLLSPQTHAQ